MAFLSQAEIEGIGFKSVGQNVKLSDRASFHNPASIDIGNNTRIDDFCILSAGRDGISIGRNVHVAAYSSLIGAAHIRLEAFSNLSSRVSIYSSNDDYSGRFMTNPTIDPEFTNVQHAAVTIGRHVIIGAGSLILPGLVLGEGACIGALSLVNRDCDPFVVYGGAPARRIGERRRDLLKHEEIFLAKEQD
jgi:acetyltransferase-like isoleucine patch superfamily enzyme